MTTGKRLFIYGRHISKAMLELEIIRYLVIDPPIGRSAAKERSEGKLLEGVKIQ